nr:retron system putative HNH endonuclease [Ancylothrix sp. D3o]
MSELQAAKKNLDAIQANPKATPQEIAKTKKKHDDAINKYRHKNIKSELETIFNGKCAYCESKVTTTGYGHIEHFFPKGDPQYLHLTFDWQNLLLSCEICNNAQHKGTNFPLDSSGNPLLINPSDGVTEINKHLKFSWDQVDGAKIEGRDDRGKKVVEIFDLNSTSGTRKELFKHRKKIVKDMLCVLTFSQTIADPHHKSEAIQLLTEYCQPTAEYSAFALVYILPYLAHHFRIPEAIILLKQVSQRSPAYGEWARVDALP